MTRIMFVHLLNYDGVPVRVLLHCTSIQDVVEALGMVVIMFVAFTAFHFDVL